MGMSSHVVGFRPPDKKWETKKSVWLVCEEAGVSIPNEVLEFFEHTHPGDKPGQEVQLGKAVQKWGDECRDGFQIDLSQLPPEVTVLRCYNSW